MSRMERSMEHPVKVSMVDGSWLTISYQHCTAEDCTWTMSHTAAFCGREQPRRCGCPYCYPEEVG